MTTKQGKHHSKPQSQDFFPKSATHAKTQGFQFNSAPLNKNKAQEQFKEQRSDAKSEFSRQKKKRSAFMAKLYQDDDELDTEMKVFNMGADGVEKELNDMSKTESGERQINKGNKVEKKPKGDDEHSRVGRLRFSKGSLGMFAIHEIHPNYLIVNFTRNAKGYVQLDATNNDIKSTLQVGQFVIASVISEGSYQYTTASDQKQNKKLQLTIDTQTVNKSLASTQLTANMIIQGQIESKEAKGFLVTLGLKDKAKGFVTFSPETSHLQIGELIIVQVKQTPSDNTKIVKCELLGSKNSVFCVPATGDYTFHSLKPGYLVHCKVSSIYENGIQVSFLGGVNGTIFQDHLEKEPSKYKVGDKCVARFIAVDPLTKKISLSLLPHIIQMKPATEDMQNKNIKVGQKFENVKVVKVIYGGSYVVDLGNNAQGFLHKIHLKQAAAATKENDDDDEVTLEVGQVLEKVIVKELNYFDGLPILSMKEPLLKTAFLDYTQIQIGQITQGTIIEVNEKDKYIVLELNDFVKGKLHLEHMSDYPLKIIPPKFKVVGKLIKIRVWNNDPEKRQLEFTKKETFLKENEKKVPVYQSYKEVQKGDKIIGVVVGENEHGHVIKSFGGVKGFITFQEIKDNGKKIKQDYKFGSIVKGYVLFKKKDQGMAITLSKKLAKELKEKQSLPNNEQSTKIFEDYLPDTDNTESVKSKYKSLVKSSQNKDNVGKVMQFRIVEETDKYYVTKSVDAAKKLLNIVAILPKCLLQSEIEIVDKETLYRGVVLEIVNDMPVISTQDICIEGANEMPKKSDAVDNMIGSIFAGIVNDVNKRGLNIRFMNGLKRLVLMKDIDEPLSISQTYKIGQAVKVGTNKVGRQSLKQKVIDSINGVGKKQSGFTDLSPGAAVSGLIKTKKGSCVFIQLPQLEGQIIIGRLHILECDSTAEFNNYKAGDKFVAKILQVFQSKKKTWVELTRRKEHMKNPIGLNQDILKSLVKSYDDLKNGQSYKAYISDINLKYSSPIHLYLSPFVKASIHFSQIAKTEAIIKSGIDKALAKYKVGEVVDVYYSNGKFSLIKQDEKAGKHEKGDLILVRAVKLINGKGLSVQMDESSFGFIEICEITDEICGQVLQLQQERSIFIARIIDIGKNKKPLLSTRESVIDTDKWLQVSPAGKTIHFQKQDEKQQSLGNQRNKILKFGSNVALQEGDLCFGYVTNIGKNGCFVQIGHNCTVRAALNELSDSQGFNYITEMPIAIPVFGRIIRVDEKEEQKRFHFSLRKSIVVFGTQAIERSELEIGKQAEVIILTVLEVGKAYAQVKGSYLKIKVKGYTKGEIVEGDNCLVGIKKVDKQKMTGEFIKKIEKKDTMNEQQRQLEKIWLSVKEEQQKDIEAVVTNNENEQEIDADMFQNNNNIDEIERQIEDLKELENDDEDEDLVGEDDSDAESMQRIIKESKYYSDNEDKEMNDEESDKGSDEDAEMEDGSIDEEGGDESKEEEKKQVMQKSGKQGLKDRIKEEQDIRKKEQKIRDNKDQPESIDDFERMLFQNQDQSYVWIQYMAFILEKLGIESARRIVERAVKSVSISNEEDKLNLWVAYMNLENNFGTQETLQKVVKRALEVNDRKRIYLQLVNIYMASKRFQYIEDIFKLLSKKYNTSLKIWSGYLEFLFELRTIKQDKQSPQHFLVIDLEISDPKNVLQRALQSLPQDKHVNIISKYGMLEFKHGMPENGRTMFEGIVNNYPKRMDIWSIYMDMEVKYGGDNKQQARHLFERCLINPNLIGKPKKMKLVFQKYMEFEVADGNKKNVEKLRARVEEYLDNAYGSTKKNNNKEEARQNDSD